MVISLGIYDFVETNYPFGKYYISARAFSVIYLNFR